VGCLEQNAVAAGIGQVEGSVMKAHLGMSTGYHTFAVGNHPVTFLGPANHAASLFERLADGGISNELLVADQVHNQFHAAVLLALILHVPLWGRQVGGIRRH
jgi:hypothetical protein